MDQLMPLALKRMFCQPALGFVVACLLARRLTDDHVDLAIGLDDHPPNGQATGADAFDRPAYLRLDVGAFRHAILGTPAFTPCRTHIKALEMRTLKSLY